VQHRMTCICQPCSTPAHVFTSWQHLCREPWAKISFLQVWALHTLLLVTAMAALERLAGCTCHISCSLCKSTAQFTAPAGNACQHSVVIIAQLAKCHLCQTDAIMLQAQRAWNSPLTQCI
jgi:hypothetical protein